MAIKIPMLAAIIERTNAPFGEILQSVQWGDCDFKLCVVGVKGTKNLKEKKRGEMVIRPHCITMLVWVAEVWMLSLRCQ